MGSRAAAPANHAGSLGNGEPPHPHSALAPAGLDMAPDQRAAGLQPEHSEALGDGVAEIPHAGDREVLDALRSGRG